MMTFKKIGGLLLVMLMSHASTLSAQNFPTRLLLRDEGLSQLSLVNITTPKDNWYVKVPNGRDLQLVGNGRVMIGTNSGFEEYAIATGKKLRAVGEFPGTIAVRKLRSGNLLLVEKDWHGSKGISLVEIDSTLQTIKTINFPEFEYARLVRETANGTFLITSNTIVFEGDAKGKLLWQASFSGSDNPHAWQAVRLADGNTLASSGYAANLQIFKPDGTLLTSISGPDDVNPKFYAGFQILPDNNIVVANWQGHGETNGDKGFQILEYSPSGKLLWSWKQDASKFSSLQGIIVLDGLDLAKAHIENEKGILAPIH